MTDAPPPMTPPDCDLRDFGSMFLDIGRLFGSEFHANANDAEWRAGVTLWLRSWHQVPAASLPVDDVPLARLAELGASRTSWKKVKDRALRGWVLCSDGRLYHRVVAEKALEAWLGKLTQRISSGAGNAKQYGIEFDREPIKRQIEAAAAMLLAIAPGSAALVKVRRYLSRPHPIGSPGGSPGGSPSGRGGGA